MKPFYLKTSAVAAASLLSLSTVALSGPVPQEMLVKGRVLAVNADASIVTVLSEPDNRPINFYGLNRTRIERPSGVVGVVADLRPGMAISVYYTSTADRWNSVRILLPDPNLANPPVTLSPAESKALDTKAAHDGDITTNPGVKARIDRDITTKPGTKDPSDPDITKRGN